MKRLKGKNGIKNMDPNKPGKRAIAMNLNRDQGIL